MTVAADVDGSAVIAPAMEQSAEMLPPPTKKPRGDYLQQFEDKDIDAPPTVTSR